MDKAAAAPETVAPAAGEPVVLDDLIKYAVEHNPRVTAARLRWEGFMEKHKVASSYDDPMLTYTQPIREIETRLGPQERVLSLSQRLPFPGKLGLKGEVVDREIEIARTGYEKVLRDLAYEVKKAYFELYYIDRATELSRENEAVLDYFTDVSRANYGLGVSELDELVRAEKLSAEASLDLIRLRDRRSVTVALLNTLLNREPGQHVGRVGEVAIPAFTETLEEVKARAIENYEDLRIAGLMVEKSGLETELARYSYRPDFSVGLNYSQIGEPPVHVPDAGTDAVSVTFGINIPLWFSRNSAEVKRAEAALGMTTAERSSVASELERKLESAYSGLERSSRVVKLYGDKLVPEAKESVDLAEARYKNGKEKLSRLLETQSMWLNFRLVYYHAVADYLKHAAELERLTHGPKPRP